MRNVTIVESNVEPNKEHLWFYNGKLKWFGPNGWEDVCVCKSPSPSTTTTTTTSTTTPPYPSSTTSTPPTFELINNTGGLLELTGFGFVDGVPSTKLPPLLNGNSVFLIKVLRDEGQFIAIYSKSHSKLGIIVDGKDEGELLEELTTNYKVIPESIYMAATKILVYSINA